MKKKEMIEALQKRLDQVEADNLVLLARIASLETKFDNQICEKWKKYPGKILPEKSIRFQKFLIYYFCNL